MLSSFLGGLPWRCNSHLGNSSYMSSNLLAKKILLKKNPSQDSSHMNSNKRNSSQLNSSQMNPSHSTSSFSWDLDVIIRWELLANWNLPRSGLGAQHHWHARATQSEKKKKVHLLVLSSLFCSPTKKNSYFSAQTMITLAWHATPVYSGQKWILLEACIIPVAL